MKMTHVTLGAGLLLALLGAQNGFALTTQELQKIQDEIMQHKDNIITKLKTDPQFRQTAVMYLEFIHSKLDKIHAAIAKLPQQYQDELGALKEQFLQKKGALKDSLYEKLQTMTKEQFEAALQQATEKVKSFLNELRERRDLMPLVGEIG